MEFNVEELTSHWIKRINRSMNNIHDQKLAKVGLTTAQVGVLAQLWSKDGLTLKEIQHKLGIRPASLTGIVDGLVQKDWVIRESDENDARVKRLYITEKGREVKGDCILAAKDIEEIVSKDFTKEEISLLLSWLKRIYKNIEC